MALRRVSHLVVSFLLVAAVALTQEHQHSPYAGHESSEIPALPPDEMQQLIDGEGMGFARAGELNHFPGPRHVLDLADELALSGAQRVRVQEIFDAMQAEARELGARIIEAERHLDLRFKNAHVDDAALREATAGIAALYGELRFTHLIAHIRVTELLSPTQIESYDRLRGYGF